MLRVDTLASGEISGINSFVLDRRPLGKAQGRERRIGNVQFIIAEIRIQPN
jgi:hypothetical protein